MSSFSPSNHPFLARSRHSWWWCDEIRLRITSLVTLRQFLGPFPPVVVAHSPAYLFAAATRVVMVVWSLFFPLGSDPILIGSFSGFKLLLSKPVVLALFSGVDGSSATRVFVLAVVVAGSSLFRRSCSNGWVVGGVVVLFVLVGFGSLLGFCRPDWSSCATGFVGSVVMTAQLSATASPSRLILLLRNFRIVPRRKDRGGLWLSCWWL
ncbi:hypothetical protein MtrunA17_Chr2g0329081 [Medicago truncatula]|uniref:Transmembrane protein, putative n=1 Tax=Medicago truncatula TaxID=3880 RepID=G7IUF3_MEDTR|nr:transmembrane protein, putative [Medicago truncatula]RHN76165.1 hypothetical protein MtrunA17_Chr2g0329081 [Medicago truncatula]